jgi:deoxyribose-phosphate aldolase
MKTHGSGKVFRDDRELAAVIDQTLLKPEAREEDVRAFLEAALEERFGAVFVSPCWVELARALIDEAGLRGVVRLGTTAGFPLGTSTTDAKCYEAVDAVERGADEIDFVINVGWLKGGREADVREEMRAIADSVRAAADGARGMPGVKAIIEAGFLTDDEKRAAVACAIEAGLDFVKTATGFGPGGATVHDVELLVRAAEGRIRVKASGGIRTLSDALALLRVGADRIGTSAGHSILAEARTKWA